MDIDYFCRTHRWKIAQIKKNKNIVLNYSACILITFNSLQSIIIKHICVLITELETTEDTIWTLFSRILLSTSEIKT